MTRKEKAETTENKTLDPEPFRHGHCDAFALALHERTNMPMAVFRGTQKLQDGMTQTLAVVHAVCVDDAGMVYDVDGRHQQEGLMEHFVWPWGQEPHRVQLQMVDRERLLAISDHEFGGFDPDRFEEARSLLQSEQYSI